MIDVAINSCGRTDVLEFSMRSFREHIKTKRTLRYLLMEDKIDDPRQDDNRREWIEKHRDWFDEVIFSKKKLGVKYGLTALMKHVNSDIFLRQDDDNIYIKDIDVDPIIDMMRENKESIAHIQWKRSVKNVFEYKGRDCELGGIKLVAIRMYSNCAGIFSKEWAEKIMKLTNGCWSPPKTVSAPAMRRLKGNNYSLSYYLGSTFDIPNCVHLGKLMSYKKGKWK